MSGHHRQARLGDVSDQAARALDLIQAIAAAKRVDSAFWQGFVARIVIDLDEVGAMRDVTRIADELAVAMRRLEDKPDGTEGP